MIALFGTSFGLSGVAALTACVLGLAIVATVSRTTRLRPTLRWNTRSWPRVRTALLTLCLLSLPLLMTACGGSGKGY
jgi:O-antigen/teichoic acid export membrane protein